MRICWKLVQVTKLKPVLVWIQGYLSPVPSYRASSGSGWETRTGSPGDVSQWLSCHEREGVWGGSTCGCYSSVTNFHQTWNSLYPKPQSNPSKRGTTKLAALPNTRSMLLDYNGIVIRTERQLRPAHTTHCDVVERCGAYEQSRYICHLKLTPLHLF